MLKLPEQPADVKACIAPMRPSDSALISGLAGRLLGLLSAPTAGPASSANRLRPFHQKGLSAAVLADPLRTPTGPSDLSLTSDLAGRLPGLLSAPAAGSASSANCLEEIHY